MKIRISIRSHGLGLSDGYEYLYGLNPKTDDADTDLDNDGLTNYQEYLYNITAHPLDYTP